MNLVIEGLVHHYRDEDSAARPVLNIGALQLSGGDQVLLRGVSGSGKTTLLNILAGLLRPSSGRIIYGQQDLTALDEPARDSFRARQVGYVFQNHHLIPSLTAAQNVVLSIAFARTLPNSQWRPRALELLDSVGLFGLADRYPRQLSTGQRLRVAVARALANRPAILLADEPTAALDKSTGESVIGLLQETAREAGGLLIVASHDPAVADRFPIIADLTAGELQLAVRA